MIVVYEWLSVSLFWMGALLFVLSLVLLFFPASLQQLSRSVDRWIETGPLFHALDRQVHVERIFYRHHRLMGILIISGAAYCLFSLLGWVDYAELTMLMARLSERGVDQILMDSALLVLGLGNLAAFVIGIFVLLRPSVLKRFERWSNTWVDSDRFIERMDERMNVTGRWLPASPRLVGLLALIGSVYIMSNTAIIALN